MRVLVIVIKPLRLCLVIFSTVFWGFASQPAKADDSSEYYEHALADFEKQDYESAYIQLKNSLQQDPDNLPAQILMGKVLLISGYLEESEEILLEALAAGADPSLIADTLGKVWLFSGQNEKILEARFQALNPQSELDWTLLEATANLNLKKVKGARLGYERALHLAPNNIKTLNALASLEIQQGNYSKAKQYLTRAFSITDIDPTTWRLQGDFHLQKGNVEEASLAYNRSFDIAPDDPLIKRSLVTVYMQKQDTTTAQKMLDEVLSQTPSDPTALLLNAWLLSQREQNDVASKELEKLSGKLGNLTEQQLRTDPSLIYVSGLSAFAQQNFQQAKTHFVQYLNFVPDNIDAIALLAQSYIKLGQPKPALEAMQRHERQLSENLEYALILGELYLANNKAFKTVEMIARLRETFPHEPRVDLLEIKTQIARGKNQQAMQSLEQHPLSNRNVGFVLTRCKLLIQMGEYQQANDIVGKLLDIAPQSTEFLNLQSAIQMNLKQWRDAEKTVDMIIKINPEHFAARFSKANILIAKGEYQPAKDVALALTEIRPDDINVLTLVARIQAGLGETDDAIMRLERVLEKDIGNLQAMELKAQIHYQRAELEKAIRQYGAAIRMAPEQPIYQMKRVELLLADRQIERARREFQHISPLISEDPVLLAEFSRIQLQANDALGAQQSIAAAYALLPDSFQLAVKYIHLHTQTGASQQAQAMLNQWMKKRPNNPQLLVLLGDLQMKDNQPQLAWNQYAAAFEIAPNYNIALAKYYQMTRDGFGQKEFEKQATATLDLQPENHFLRNLLADYYLDQHRYGLALPHYEKLLEVDGLGNRVVILNNLANIYIPDDINKAEALIEQAVQSNSNNAAVLDTYGWIKTLQGKLEEGLTLLRRAYAMDSDNPANLYHLAYSLDKLNRGKEARSYAQKALRNGVKSEDRRATEALLKSLE